MYGPNVGLEIGKRTPLAQRWSLNITGRLNGMTTVYLGSMALVDGITHNDLHSRISNDGNSICPSLYFKVTAIELKNAGGQLEGMLDTRQEIITAKLAELDTMARELVSAVNEIHRLGQGSNGATAIKLFDPNVAGAADIKLSESIERDLGNIAAGRQFQRLRNGRLEDCVEDERWQIDIWELLQFDYRRNWHRVERGSMS
jgi:flagellar hook-associated protein FlgK